MASYPFYSDSGAASHQHHHQHQHPHAYQPQHYHQWPTHAHPEHYATASAPQNQHQYAAYYTEADPTQAQCDDAYADEYYYNASYAQREHELSSAHGLGGYPYAEQSSATIPVAIPAAPPEPYNTERSERVYGSEAPIAASYAAAYHVHDAHAPSSLVTYRTPAVSDAAAQYYAHAQYAQLPPSHQHYIDTTLAPSMPAYVSPTHSHAPSTSSSLADALRSPILAARHDLPTPLSRLSDGSASFSTPATAPSPARSIAASTPPTLYDSPEPDYGEPSEIPYTFVLESGPPPPRASASSSSADAASPGPPRKKRSPPKGPRKEQGFLACYFCRGRKIACNAPPPGSDSTSCEQCTKRHLVCEFPTESRRGQRGLGNSRSGSSNKSHSVSRRERREAHLAMTLPPARPPPPMSCLNSEHDLEGEGECEDEMVLVEHEC